MLMRISSKSRHIFVLAFVAPFVLIANVTSIRSQQLARPKGAESSVTSDVEHVGATSEKHRVDKKPETTEEKLSALEQLVERQGQQLDQLQRTLSEQQELIRMLAGKLSPVTTTPAVLTTNAPVLEVRAEAQPQAAPTPGIEDRLKKVETRVSEIGNVRFSGDIRLRSESIFGQSNGLTNANIPSILGNDLTPRHRMRLRARLTMRGSVTDEFDWGIRLATGTFADNISTNQTMSDFFNRKPFALDQAFVIYKPKWAPRLQLQGGKFEAPWAYRFDNPWPAPELITDNDLMVEGFNESYVIRKKDEQSRVKEIKFIAWQLPFLERNSAFVRNANGTVNVDESRRGGRDLGLFGGQIRTRFESKGKWDSCAKAARTEKDKAACPARIGFDLAVSDLYFSGTQFISPVQVFGTQLSLPVTFTIPASGATPAQTITTQALIPRDLLVAGNANLGVSIASNNATNRDGRLASGFNLVELFARLELKYSKQYPVTLVFNAVTNTRVRDVVAAGPGGADLILPNNENHGFWAEVQVGQMRARGDLLFGYTFMRIEKDAVLTPFNISDVTQQSDMRAHRLNFAYTANPRVLLVVTGIVTQRAHGLFGPFVPTPPGSLNRPTTRIQLDTILRF
ncbi:MAG TPA: putative porin [Pyrinomonadaceae bacterium]|nr:putative porin [Pyrinomonadaceae bacterium]